MKTKDPSATPLVSVTTSANYFGQMMDALEQGDIEALRSAVSNLSPSDLNTFFTHSITKSFGIPSEDLPLPVREDLHKKEMIHISAVHYAASKGDKSSLKILLNGGADPNLKDGFGQTALHILPKCDWKYNAEEFQGCLDLLLDCEYIDANRLDLSKSSPLSRAEEYHWSYMENKLKQMGIDGTPYDRSSQVAKSQTFLADSLLMDLLNNNLEGFITTLDAIETLGIDKKYILDESHGSYSLLQYACKCCKFDFVDLLLKNGASPTKKDDVNLLSAVMSATKYGYHKILLRLFNSLDDKQFQNGVIEEVNENKETSLHLSVMCYYNKDSSDVDYFQCLQILLKKKKYLDINATNYDGNTALHFAALCEDTKAFSFLLKQGANCTIANVFGHRALHYVNKEGIVKILNDCIEFDIKKHIVDKDFVIELNYKMMQTGDSGEVCDKKEMTFLNTVASIFPDKEVLYHPLIDIFIYLKWQTIRKFFHLNLILHLVFLGLLLTYIYIYHRTLNSVSTSDAEVSTTTSDQKVTKNAATFQYLFIAFLLISLILREVVQIIIVRTWKEYIANPKHIVQIITAILAVTLLCIPLSDKVKMAIAAWLVLISLLEFILHLGRFPTVAVYITMFKQVSWNFLKFISLFFIIILAFSFSFYLMFQVSDEFKTFPESLLKTIIMTTGEVGYEELPVSAFPVASHILMVLFVFLILLVLMNLLNGLAVSDIQEIQKQAEIISCMSLVDRMAQLEQALYCSPVSRNPFKKVLNYFFRVSSVFEECIPNHQLLVNIFQYENDTRPKICDCHSSRLEVKHIRDLKRLVMEKRSIIMN